MQIAIGVHRYTVCMVDWSTHLIASPTWRTLRDSSQGGLEDKCFVLEARISSICMSIIDVLYSSNLFETQGHPQNRGCAFATSVTFIPPSKLGLPVSSTTSSDQRCTVEYPSSGHEF